MNWLLLAMAAVGAQGSDATVRETRRMIDDYGRCIVKEQQRRASNAVLRVVTNAELLREYPGLVNGRCIAALPGMTVKVRFSGDHFRYALADALVRAELAAGPPPVLDAVPRLTHFEPTVPSRINAKGRPLSDKDYQEALRAFEADRGFAFLSAYGECVVRVNPAAAKSLLLAKPESAQEAAQFGVLTPALGSCLPAGRTLGFGKLALRGTIAVNYYRLAKAAQAGAGA